MDDTRLWDRMEAAAGRVRLNAAAGEAF